MIFRNTERSHLVRRIRDGYPVKDVVHLQFGNCGIRVQSNSGRVISELRQYFSAFVSQPTAADRIVSVHQADDASVVLPFNIRQPNPKKTRIKEEFADIPGGRIVRKKLTGMVFIFGGNDHVVIGPCLKNMNQVVNFINNRYIEWQLCRGGILGHAYIRFLKLSQVFEICGGVDFKAAAKACMQWAQIRMPSC
jgi:HprK-related kinase B